MEFFDTYQSSGSVKVTQEPIEQYISLQEHRDVSVQHLNCCDWTAGKNCICPMSASKDGTLDSEDLSALRSVYQELLGFDDRTIIDMPFTVTEFKAVKVGSMSYGSLQSQTSRNATVLANWAGPDGSLACTTGCNDTRPGQVLKFFRHCFKVKSMSADSSDKRYEFYLAQVNWFSKHPERYAYGLPVELV